MDNQTRDELLVRILTARLGLKPAAPETYEDYYTLSDDELRICYDPTQPEEYLHWALDEGGLLAFCSFVEREIVGRIGVRASLEHTFQCEVSRVLPEIVKTKGPRVCHRASSFCYRASRFGEVWSAHYTSSSEVEARLRCLAAMQ